MYPVKQRRRRGFFRTALILLPVLIVVLALLLVSNRFRIAINLYGEAHITMEYGTEFSDPGAEVTIRGSRFWREARPVGVVPVVTGEVDTDRVGDYTLSYRAQVLWFSLSETRTVSVIDSVPPEITLISDPGWITIPGQPYTEEGFSAWDAYDGDLTEQVERREENGWVYYRVTDSSGNCCSVAREILYRDTTPPVIQLAGETQMRIGLGTRYAEPGFTALDQRDGNLTEHVAVEGTVDHRRTGNYRITYRVSDESGNEAVAERTVIVERAMPPKTVTPEGKVIYLTFDDGPGIFTRELLEVLDKYGVKATFFVVGNQPELMRAITKGGHAIGIHTVSHDYQEIYASEEAYFRDLFRMQDNIYEATGVWTTLMRFPGGSSNTVSGFNEGIMTRLTGLVQDYGFQYYDWNVDSNDAGGARTAERVCENVIDGVSNRRVSIVLQHDIKDYSVEAVEQIILWALDHGYTFLPLQPDSPNCHHGVNN